MGRIELGGNSQTIFKSFMLRAEPANYSNKLASRAYTKNDYLPDNDSLYVGTGAANASFRLDKYVQLWLAQEITFTMNRMTLATIVFGLMGLGILFFVIGFLVAIATVDRTPTQQQAQKFNWASASTTKISNPQEGFIDRELKAARNYTASALARIARQKAANIEGQLVGNTVASLNTYIPEPLQPFAMHAEQELSQTTYEAGQELSSQLGKALTSNGRDAKGSVPTPANTNNSVRANGRDGIIPEKTVPTTRRTPPIPAPSAFQQALRQRNIDDPAYQATPRGVYPTSQNHSQTNPMADYKNAPPMASYGGNQAYRRPQRIKRVPDAYVLRVKAFYSKQKANNMSRQLNKLDINSKVTPEYRGRNKIYVVRIGEFANYEAASRAAKSFEKWFQHKPKIDAVRR